MQLSRLLQGKWRAAVLDLAGAVRRHPDQVRDGNAHALRAEAGSRHASDAAARDHHANFDACYKPDTTLQSSCFADSPDGLRLPGAFLDQTFTKD